MQPIDPWEHVETEAAAALEAKNLDEVLEILMNGYGNALFRFCMRIVRDETVAEDVLQTTFVQAYQGLPGFQGRSTLRSWLFGIARHRGLDSIKIDRRREARIHLVEELPEVAVDRSSDPDRRAVRNELQSAMEGCLGQLSEAVRETLLMRFRDGLTYPEMAEITGDKPPALQARVTRSLPLLKRCLEEKGMLDDGLYSL